MSQQYSECRPTNAWDLFVSLGHPRKFQRVSRLSFLTAATSLTGGQPNFARCLAVSCVGTLYTQFRGPCPLRDFTQCKTHYVQVLLSPILAALLRGTAAAGVRQTLRRGIQGMELRNFRRRRHLYSARRPLGLRWASAHILVWFLFTSSRWTNCFMFIRIHQNSKLYWQKFGLVNQNVHILYKLCAFSWLS